MDQCTGHRTWGPCFHTTSLPLPIFNLKRLKCRSINDLKRLNLTYNKHDLCANITICFVRFSWIFLLQIGTQEFNTLIYPSLQWNFYSQFFNKQNKVMCCRPVLHDREAAMHMKQHCGTVVCSSWSDSINVKTLPVNSEIYDYLFWSMPHFSCFGLHSSWEVVTCVLIDTFFPQSNHV